MLESRFKPGTRVLAFPASAAAGVLPQAVQIICMKLQPPCALPGIPGTFEHNLPPPAGMRLFLCMFLFPGVQKRCNRLVWQTPVNTGSCVNSSFISFIIYKYMNILLSLLDVWTSIFDWFKLRWSLTEPVFRILANLCASVWNTRQADFFSN